MAMELKRRGAASLRGPPMGFITIICSRERVRE
jgi:hypothetical protein